MAERTQNTERQIIMTQTFETLVSLQHGTAEANVESLLREYLSLCCKEVIWRQQSTTSAGIEDLTSTQLNIVIECKKPGYISLEANEKQLRNYVCARYSVRDSLLWRGFITDGNLWWGYDFEPQKQELKHINGVIGYRINDEPNFRIFCDQFIFSRYDPSLREVDINDLVLFKNMFRARFNELEGIQRELESRVGYSTKIQLWELQLKGSGIIPPQNESSAFAEHFRRHTFLVIVSRMLCALLSEENALDGELVDSVSEGFQSWVQETEIGRQMLVRLAQDLRQYCWRDSTRDVLKALYHGLIPKDQRKEFGEFYTPDYLAAAVVDEVLDDSWCDVQIKRAWKILNGQHDDRLGFGVLDPSCGSGTFLFHVARRLCARIASHHREFKHRASEIVSQLVYGIDIHPIAVEMSQATLMMALPYAAKPIHLNIALGDALQTDVNHYMFNPDGLSVTTPRGTEILLPQSIVKRSDALEIISWAVHRQEDLASVACYEEDEDCVRLADAIQEVISTEENHVWKWHLSNRHTFYTLMNSSVGRLVGNPPWLVHNDTPDGVRKKNLNRMRQHEGMKDEVLGYLPQGDLASLFTARVIRLYLDTTVPNNRYAWVLPGSALINQVWQKWRTGILAGDSCSSMKHERAWSLDRITPPIFAHAPNGTCVFFGRKDKNRRPPDLIVEHWTGNFETAQITESRLSQEATKSYYFDYVRSGCFYRPNLYYVVDEVKEKDGDIWTIRTQMGTRNQWKNKWHEGKIEKEALLPLVTSKNLSPPPL